MQMDDNNGTSLALLPNQRDALKDKPTENTPLKSLSSVSPQETPATKSSKAKRKPGGDYIKSPNGVPAKKIKTDNVCFEVFFCTIPLP